MTAAMSFAVAPGVLRVTGPVLCPAGSDFVTEEGATVDLGDNRRGAPVRFSCAGANGATTEARVGLAILTLGVTTTALWWLAIMRIVRRLLASAQGARAPGKT